MAVRGSESKQKIKEKIMEIFPDAFVVDKVIRVPMQEDGETVEIKISLTAAKDVIGGAASKPVVTSGATSPNPEVPFEENMNPPIESNGEDWKMTKEEEEKVAGILGRLGL